MLYGTGWRNLKDRNEIEVMIDGTKAQVLYAGAQGIFEGLDQINLLLPRAYTTEAKIEIRIAGNPINIARFRLR